MNCKHCGKGVGFMPDPMCPWCGNIHSSGQHSSGKFMECSLCGGTLLDNGTRFTGPGIAVLLVGIGLAYFLVGIPMIIVSLFMREQTYKCKQCKKVF